MVEDLHVPWRRRAYNIRTNGEVQFIDSDLFGPLKEWALASQRLRTNHNFHSGNEDNPHRFLNVMARGTNVPPHRHLDPLKSETFLILEGKVGVFLFDDEGKVALAEVVGGTERLGADIPAGALAHTGCVDAVCGVARGQAGAIRREERQGHSSLGAARG